MFRYPVRFILKPTHYPACFYWEAWDLSWRPCFLHNLKKSILVLRTIIIIFIINHNRTHHGSIMQTVPIQKGRYLILHVFLKLIYLLWERQRQREWKEARERGRERETLKQAPRCQSRARRGARTHKTARRWPEPKPRLGAQPTEPPRSPLVLHWSHRKNTTYMRDPFEVKAWSFTQICPMIFLINTDCSAPVSKWNSFSWPWRIRAEESYTASGTASGIRVPDSSGLFGDVERDILVGMDKDDILRRSQNHDVVGTWVSLDFHI